MRNTINTYFLKEFISAREEPQDPYHAHSDRLEAPNTAKGVPQTSPAHGSLLEPRSTSTVAE